MADEDIKKLPPEERIKKLKELEAKKKKEIEEGQKSIKESQEEIKDRRKWLDKVPIPEMGKEELEGLSPEGKQILQVSKRLPKKEEPSEQVKKVAASLEETVQTEKIAFAPQGRKEYDTTAAMQAFGAEYKPLSQVSIPEMYQVVSSVNRAIEEKGYMNPTEVNLIRYASSEIERRLEDVEAGKYKGFTEEVAQAASVIQQMSMERLRGYIERREHKYK